MNVTCNFENTLHIEKEGDYLAMWLTTLASVFITMIKINSFIDAHNIAVQSLWLRCQSDEAQENGNMAFLSRRGYLLWRCGPTYHQNDGLPIFKNYCFMQTYDRTQAQNIINVFFMWRAATILCICAYVYKPMFLCFYQMQYRGPKYSFVRWWCNTSKQGKRISL